jgi:hypothetical protein
MISRCFQEIGPRYQLLGSIGQSQYSCVEHGLNCKLIAKKRANEFAVHLENIKHNGTI